MKNIIKKIDFYFRFRNPFYNFILEKRAVSELIFIPENIWSADSENGRKIVEGFLNFHNETIFFDLNVWKQNNSSKLWNEKLHSFDWVRDVRALGTNKARIFTSQFGICLVGDFLKPASFKILPTSTKNISDSLTIIRLSLVDLFNIEKM